MAGVLIRISFRCKLCTNTPNMTTSTFYPPPHPHTFMGSPREMWELCSNTREGMREEGVIMYFVVCKKTAGLFCSEIASFVVSNSVRSEFSLMTSYFLIAQVQTLPSVGGCMIPFNSAVWFPVAHCAPPAVKPSCSLRCTLQCLCIWRLQKEWKQSSLSVACITLFQLLWSHCLVTES